MHAIYSIHPDTLAITIRSIHDNYIQALNNLNMEAENYIKLVKGQNNIRYIIKKDELIKNNDGYYLKMSSKYSNRISIHEKNTKVNDGYFYNSYNYTIKKIMVYSMFEIANTPRIIEYENVNNKSNKEITKNIIDNRRLSYIDELRESLSKRRLKIAGK